MNLLRRPPWCWFSIRLVVVVSPRGSPGHSSCSASKFPSIYTFPKYHYRLIVPLSLLPNNLTRFRFSTMTHSNGESDLAPIATYPMYRSLRTSRSPVPPSTTSTLRKPTSRHPPGYFRVDGNFDNATFHGTRNEHLPGHKVNTFDPSARLTQNRPMTKGEAGEWDRRTIES